MTKAYYVQTTNVTATYYQSIAHTVLKVAEARKDKYKKSVIDDDWCACLRRFRTSENTSNCKTPRTVEMFSTKIS